MWCCAGAEHCSVPLLYSSPLIGFTLILLQSSVLWWAALRAGVCFPPCLVESGRENSSTCNLFCSLPAWLIVHKAVRDDSNQPQLSLSWRSQGKTCRRALKHYLVLLVLFLALPSPSLLTCLWPHPPHYAHSQVPAPFCFPHIQTLQSADTHTLSPALTFLGCRVRVLGCGSSMQQCGVGALVSLSFCRSSDEARCWCKACWAGVLNNIPALIGWEACTQYCLNIGFIGLLSKLLTAVAGCMLVHWLVLSPAQEEWGLSVKSLLLLHVPVKVLFG